MASDSSPGASGWSVSGFRRYEVLPSNPKNTLITNHGIPCYSALYPALPGSLLTSAQFQLSSAWRKSQESFLKCRDFLRRRKFRSVIYVGDVVMSAITCAELEYGVAISPNPDKERINLANLLEDIPVIPFDAAVALAYGPIRLVTPDGSRKDALDKLIAAQAVALNVTLATNNENDFARYPGLIVENWIEAARQ